MADSPDPSTTPLPPSTSSDSAPPSRGARLITRYVLPLIAAVAAVLILFDLAQLQNITIMEAQRHEAQQHRWLAGRFDGEGRAMLRDCDSTMRRPSCQPRAGKELLFRALEQYDRAIADLHAADGVTSLAVLDTVMVCTAELKSLVDSVRAGVAMRPGCAAGATEPRRSTAAWIGANLSPRSPLFYVYLLLIAVSILVLTTTAVAVTARLLPGKAEDVVEAVVEQIKKSSLGAATVAAASLAPAAAIALRQPPAPTPHDAKSTPSQVVATIDPVLHQTLHGLNDSLHALRQSVLNVGGQVTVLSTKVDSTSSDVVQHVAGVDSTVRRTRDTLDLRVRQVRTRLGGTEPAPPPTTIGQRSP